MTARDWPWEGSGAVGSGKRGGARLERVSRPALMKSGDRRFDRATTHQYQHKIGQDNFRIQQPLIKKEFKLQSNTAVQVQIISACYLYKCVLRNSVFVYEAPSPLLCVSLNTQGCRLPQTNRTSPHAKRKEQGAALVICTLTIQSSAASFTGLASRPTSNSTWDYFGICHWFNTAQGSVFDIAVQDGTPSGSPCLRRLC